MIIYNDQTPFEVQKKFVSAAQKITPRSKLSYLSGLNRKNLYVYAYICIDIYIEIEIQLTSKIRE